MDAPPSTRVRKQAATTAEIEATAPPVPAAAAAPLPAVSAPAQYAPPLQPTMYQHPPQYAPLSYDRNYLPLAPYPHYAYHTLPPNAYSAHHARYHDEFDREYYHPRYSDRPDQWRSERIRRQPDTEDYSPVKPKRLRYHDSAPSSDPPIPDTVELLE